MSEQAHCLTPTGPSACAGGSITSHPNGGNSLPTTSGEPMQRTLARVSESLPAQAAAKAAAFADELVAFRRDLHMHPELGREEFRTTGLVRERLVLAGLAPRLLPGTGLVCDIGPDGRGATSGRPFRDM